MKKLRNLFTLALITLVSFTINAQSEDKVAGEYHLGKQNTIIKIAQADGVYKGKIIASDNPKAKIGKQMVKDLKEKEGKWMGKIYSPKREEWYDAEFVPNEKQLIVKLKVGFFSKTLEWKRN